MQSIQQLRQLLQIKEQHLVAFEGHKQFSLSQFQQDVKQCVSNIRKKPYQHYLLLSDNSYEFAVNFIALLIQQKDIVLTANHKAEWLQSIASSYEVLITDNATLGDNNSTIISSDHYKHLKQTTAPIDFPEELSSQIQFYTSGSSSQPKAVSKSIQQLLLEVDTLESVFAEHVTSCYFLASVSHHHIYGLIFRLLWPLVYKRPFDATMTLYPEQLIDVSDTLANICLISSPAFLSRQDSQLKPLVLTCCFSSGSLLTKETAEASYQQLGIYPTEVFGSTETGGIGYRNRQHANNKWSFFPGVSIDIARHEEMENEERAWLNSPYLHQVQVLDDKIRLLPNHQFELLGRLDRVVKIEEKRVSLDDIENKLESSKYVQKAKVIVLQQHRTFLGAAIKLSAEGKKLLVQNNKNHLNQVLRKTLSNKFEAVAIPRKWRYLDQLPYNTQGKLPIDALTVLF